MSRESEKLLKRIVPKKTGKLRNSIKVKAFKQEKRTILEIYALFYFLFLDVGTKAHMIRSKRAKALHFEIKGKEVFAMWSRVKGIKGRHYSDQALKKAKEVSKHKFKLKIK